MGKVGRLRTATGQSLSASPPQSVLYASLIRARCNDSLSLYSMSHAMDSGQGTPIDPSEAEAKKKKRRTILSLFTSGKDSASHGMLELFAFTVHSHLCYSPLTCLSHVQMKTAMLEQVATTLLRRLLGPNLRERL